MAHNDQIAIAPMTDRRNAFRCRTTAGAKLGSHVHECRRAAEQRCDQHTNRNRDLESRDLVVEENPRGSNRVDRQESARDQERERQEEHARIAAPLGRLPGEIRKHERAAADSQEQHEMQPRAGPLGSSARRKNNDTRPMSGRINATTDARATKRPDRGAVAVRRRLPIKAGKRGFIAQRAPWGGRGSFASLRGVATRRAARP